MLNPGPGLWPRVESPEVQRSTTIEKLIDALSKAQAKIKNAAKDAENPHFQSRYADLASVWEACREPLTEQGLAVVQFPVGEGDHVGLTTYLAHSSGQWMCSTIYATPERKGPQAVGSVLTYLRRYALAAVVGVAPDDDDGNAASDHGRQAPAPANDNGQRIATQRVAARRAPEPPPVAGAETPAPSSSGPPSVRAMRKYHALREGMGVSEDDGRERVAKVLGRAIGSMNDLTSAELTRIIDKMEASANASA